MATEMRPETRALAEELGRLGEEVRKRTVVLVVLGVLALLAIVVIGVQVKSFVRETQAAAEEARVAAEQGRAVSQNNERVIAEVRHRFDQLVCYASTLGETPPPPGVDCE